VYLTNTESERLKYRPLTLEDIDHWSTYTADERSRTYLPFTELSPVDFATFWIKRQLKRYENNQYGQYAVILKETGEFIGQCGVQEQEVDGIKEIEVGYHFFPDHWGNGYATEAAIHFKNWGLNNKIASSIISIIHIDNLASQAVARKNGMTIEKRTEWNGIPVDIFRTP
jgi:RimJ/RimL family protein N-acetyltransferase